MVLESTLICFDNSEDMRNGDFIPSRLRAQQDAANLLIQCKLRSNPENSVGLLSLADRVTVLTTLTTDNNKLFAKLQQIQPNGISRFLIGMKIAHLALKHRQNRNHKPRIVLFVGSLLTEEDGELVKTAKKFKKEKVNVDVVCFGDESQMNFQKLENFLNAINGKDGSGSHMIVVPPGADLQQALLTSAIVRNEDGTGPPMVASGQGQAFFDVDPNEDPELALALRVSLEEQRARQEAEAAAATASQQPVAGAGELPAATPQAGGGVAPAARRPLVAMTEEEQLALALQMSLEQNETSSSEPKSVDVEPMDTSDRSVSLDAGTDEASASVDDIGELMSDPSALQALVSSLPGVDPNSDVVQQALAQAAADKSKQQKKPDPKTKDKSGDK